MAQFKNNQFTSDTHDEHSLRVSMCIDGMDTYSGEVEFRADLPDKMQEHLENWDAFRSGLSNEWGEQKGATVLVNLLKDELHEMIIDCRYMLFSMLDEEDLDDVTDSDIRKAYHLDNKIPKRTEGKIELARDMNEKNQFYVDEGSPWALPEADFNEMADKAEELENAVKTQAKEILDVYHANKLLAMERKRGDRLLSRAFKWLVAAWDDDDERLFAFGMVPKSAIWTEGEPEPGVPEWPVHPEAADFAANYLGEGFVELVYSKVTGAVKARLRRRLVDGVADWEIVFDGLPMGGEEHLPFRERDVPPGKWEYEFVSYNAESEPSEPAYATVIVPEEIPA